MKQMRNYTISRCVCMECGLVFPIPRKKQSARKKGHIKNLWCLSCKEIRKFYEIRDCDLDIRIGNLKARNEQCICICEGGRRYDGCTERIVGENVSVM